jgi:outer membrane protein
MKTKFSFRGMALLAAAALTISACNSDKMDEKPAPANVKSVDGLKIAYVEVDTIMSQYEFCKEYKKILEKRQQTVESSLASQQKSLESAAQNFQNKLQNNGFASRAEAESQQAALLRQEQNLQASAQRLQSELLDQTEKFNQALRDSIQHFLTQYNKDKKLSMILTKQGDNILLADKSLDITAEVVAGLNKAYKSKPEDVEKSAAKTTTEKAPEKK